PRHHRVHRDLLDGVLPVLAEVRRAHAPDDLVGLAPRAAEHRAHTFFRRQHDRQRVRPVPLEEEAMQVLLGVGLDEARRRTIALAGPTPAVTRTRETVDHLLHDVAAADRIGAIDVRAQLRRRLANDRLWYEHLREIGHAADL